MDFKKRASKIISNGPVVFGTAGEGYYLAEIEKALKEVWNEAKEQDAKLLDSWHIKKGGFTTLAHEIRELKVKS